MQKTVIELLHYPRWLVLNELEARRCVHGGYFNLQDRECQACELCEECRWLSEHDAFMALARRPLPELLKALDFALDYVDLRAAEHNTRACVCGSCDWLRRARRFMRNYRPAA